VTGASGFVGGVTCAQLREAGHDVLALVRRPGSEPPGTTAVAADLVDADALSAALAETRPEGVIHLAAEIASQRDAARIDAVNVGGTRALLVACAELEPQPKVVFASTVVTGEADGRVLTEDEPLPVTTVYGRSKQEGERLLAQSGLPYAVVRPSHVYGPGGWYAEDIVKRLRQPGRFCVIGGGKNLWDVVHVDDVAAALVLALDTAPSGETYHCADDEPLTYRAFMELTARELGVGRPRNVPAWLARLAAGADTVTAVTRSARSSNAKLKGLGWTPRYPRAADGVPVAVAGL
jgi:nucleoside-diphosphate-sugar epimerase